MIAVVSGGDWEEERGTSGVRIMCASSTVNPGGGSNDRIKLSVGIAKLSSH